MKHLVVVALLVFIGFAGWRAGGVLSTDAISMAVGMIFGVLASIPAALLILAAQRRSERTQPPQQPAVTGGHTPVVVVAPPAYPDFGLPTANQLPQLPGQQVANWPPPAQAMRPERSFTIIGEQAEIVDDF